jgi:phosphate/sulfate permease
MPIELIVIIAIALVFDFLNGFHDSSNIVATVISSRALPPRIALTMTAIAEFCGPFLFGVAVATTIGSEVVDPEAITSAVIIAALTSAVLWNLFTWYFGLPSSTSHALIGGLVGAVSAGSGLETINPAGLGKVLVSLFVSPLLGLVLGFLMLKLIYFLARGATPGVNTIFKRGQWPTSLALALSHGTNDAQKTMGIIAALFYATIWKQQQGAFDASIVSWLARSELWERSMSIPRRFIRSMTLNPRELSPASVLSVQPSPTVVRALYESPRQRNPRPYSISTRSRSLSGRCSSIFRYRKMPPCLTCKLRRRRSNGPR